VVSMVIPGCSSNSQVTVVPVTGHVTQHGQPVENVLISFECRSAGFAATALVNPDGSYRLHSKYGKGIPSGEYQVSVSRAVTRDQYDNPVPEPDGKRQIPAKYEDARTSKLVANVKPGSTTFDFVLD